MFCEDEKNQGADKGKNELQQDEKPCEETETVYSPEGNVSEEQTGVAGDAEEAERAECREEEMMTGEDERPKEDAEECAAEDEPTGCTPEGAEGDVQEDEDEEESIPSMEETEAALDFEPLEPGDVVEGTVVQVNDDNVLVDVHYKSDGVIPLSELRLKPDEKPQDVFSVGKKIPVYILSVNGQDDAVLASYRRALDTIAWDRLHLVHEEEEIIEAPVVEEVKGGLVLDVLGLRGFMPASHVDRGFVSDLSAYVGEKVNARVIELDRNKNRIIVSRKVVREKEHEEKQKETWASLEEGEVRTGVVKGITGFGAFVDLGGVDGLLHVSQMSWGRVDHPSDVASEGEEIEVKVLRVNPEEEKISLGIKQLQPDPWESVGENYSPSELVKGRVTRIAPFGAFVELEPGIEGLVHISELADYHVYEPSEVVSEGEDIEVKVLHVDPDDRRIALSLKEVRQEDETKTKSRRRTGGLSLGDVFGDLLTESRDRLSDEEEQMEESEEREQDEEEEEK